MSTSTAWTALGFGTLLLACWRFVPLPFSVSLSLLPLAIGALATGIALLCRAGIHTWPQAFKAVAIGAVVTGLGLLHFRIDPLSAESLPLVFGFVVVSCALVTRAPRWAIIPTLVVAAGLDYVQLFDDRPFPIVIAALLTMLLCEYRWVNVVIGAAFIVTDRLLLAGEDFSFLISGHNDQFTVVSPLEAIGAALLVSGLCQILPDVRPIKILGRSSLTFNVAMAVVATVLGSGSATFNWIRYSPLSGMEHEKVYQPLSSYSILLHGHQSWTMALAVSIALIFVVVRHSEDLLEWLVRRTVFSG